MSVSDPKTGRLRLNFSELTLINRFRRELADLIYRFVDWELTPDLSCDCGADAKTMKHMKNECPKQSFREGLACLYCVCQAGLKFVTGSTARIRHNFC